MQQQSHVRPEGVVVILFEIHVLCVACFEASEVGESKSRFEVEVLVATRTVSVTQRMQTVILRCWGGLTRTCETRREMTFDSSRISCDPNRLGASDL